MPDLVISNTSPLFYLHGLGQLKLLRNLYQNIIVPEAVVEELRVGKKQGEEVPDVSNYNWIKIRSVHIPEVISLITDLGPGEAQVLTLALENPDSLVILDDRLAREIAKTANVRVTGTAGILLKAKQEGHIEAVKPFLDKLIQINFRLSNDLVNTILRLANE